MLQRTGVGFNDSTKLIECTDELWDLVVKKDGNARSMRYRHWPLFEDWKEIFGKDRATGEHAEDVMDAVNEMMAGQNLNQFGGGEAYQPNLDDNPTEEHEGSNCDEGDKSSQGGRNSSRKRKAPEGIESIHQMLSQLCRTTDQRFERIAERIGYEFDLGNAKKQVFDMISTIPGLSLDQQFDVSRLLTQGGK